MSDPNPFYDGGDPGPNEGTPDGGTADTGLPSDTPPQVPPRSYLDVDDDTAERYVRVKVDGTEQEVPLREALAGYSRTADYTRKTQELAAQRQQAEYALSLQRALESHPQEALGILARQYGVNLEQQQSPPPSREQPSTYDDGYNKRYADPVEQRLAQIERQNQALSQQWEQRQADEQLRQAVAGITQRYNLTPADTREVVTTALSSRMGPESFEMIWKTIAFDRAQQARAQAASRQQAAAQASQLISNGASATRAGTAPAPEASGPMSIAQAFELAMQNKRVGE